MDYGIYTVHIDYGSGGHHEIVAAFEHRKEAVVYAKYLRDRILVCTDPFFEVEDTHDGYFLFRTESIIGIRVVPDIGTTDDDDDDDDDAPDEKPDGPSDKNRHPPAPITDDEFKAMMKGSNLNASELETIKKSGHAAS